jgi:hypothetical protein
MKNKVITKEGKKELIKRIIKSGDTRSWYAIAADIELQIWTQQFHPDLTKLIKPKKDDDKQG